MTSKDTTAEKNRKQIIATVPKITREIKDESWKINHNRSERECGAGCLLIRTFSETTSHWQPVCSFGGWCSS